MGNYSARSTAPADRRQLTDRASIHDALAVDARNIYALSMINGTLTSVPKNGGPWTELVSGLDYQLVQITPKPLLYANGQLVFDDDRALCEVEVAGGAMAVLAAGIRTSNYAVDASSGYWTDTASREIRTIAR